MGVSWTDHEPQPDAYAARHARAPRRRIRRMARAAARGAARALAAPLWPEHALYVRLAGAAR